MRIWLIEAISAVNVMIKVLVPTAVFKFIPRKKVNTINIIIPPPVPTKPVPKPIVKPKKREMVMSFRANFEPFFVVFLCSLSGLMRKRIPMQKVKNKENDPKALLPARYAI